MENLEHLSKDELIDLLKAYDSYIIAAADSGRLSTGWTPVCISEFYSCEYQDVWRQGESFDYMYDYVQAGQTEHPAEVAQPEEESPFVFVPYTLFAEYDVPFPSFSVEVRTTQHLTDKLRSFLEPWAAESLQAHPAPTFYAQIYVGDGMVGLGSRFYLSSDPGAMPQFVEGIRLTPEEKAVLVDAFEAACRQSHNGQDCLTVINGLRKDKELPPIRRVLASSIESAEARKPTAGSPGADARTSNRTDRRS